MFKDVSSKYKYILERENVKKKKMEKTNLNFSTGLSFSNQQEVGMKIVKQLMKQD